MSETEWSATEKDFFEKLEARTHDNGDAIEVPDIYTARRFLRARKDDVAAAIDQYVSTMKWRRCEAVDGILAPDENELIYRAICPHRNHGYSKSGLPIYIERTGLIRAPKLLKYLAPEKLVRRHVRQQEIAMSRMRKSAAKRGHNVDRQIVILDLAGLSLLPNKTAIDVFRETVKIDQAYYPETLEKFFIINAPWIFHPLWAMVKPWLDPVTRHKFSVSGSNYQSALLEVIDADQLPKILGGSCDCPGGCIGDLQYHLLPNKGEDD